MLNEQRINFLIGLVSTLIFFYLIWRGKKKMGMKQDRKRIALGQPHEVAYIKRCIKEQLEHMKYINWRERVSKAKLKRICKACQKALKKLK